MLESHILVCNGTVFHINGHRYQSTMALSIISMVTDISLQCHCLSYQWSQISVYNVTAYHINGQRHTSVIYSSLTTYHINNSIIGP